MGGGLVECFVFDWGEPTKASLFASTVIGALDPDDNRNPQVVSCGPSLPIQHVLLQQRGERLSRCVVPGGADPTHPSDHVEFVEGRDERP